MRFPIFAKVSIESNFTVFQKAPLLHVFVKKKMFSSHDIDPKLHTHNVIRYAIEPILTQFQTSITKLKKKSIFISHHEAPRIRIHCGTSKIANKIAFCIHILGKSC